MGAKSRTVLITGATAGIGKHVALDLVARGHRVLATGRNLRALEALRDEAAQRGVIIETVILDVTDAESIRSAAEAVKGLTAGRGVDVLVNNAGYGQGGPVMELGDDVLRKQFETNVFGLMAVTRAFVPDMIARGEGWILNVSSIGGRITFPFFGAYHASKYAVEALSDALRTELRGFGVRVVLIEPGPITSEFSERAFTSLPQGDAAARYASSYARADGIRATSDRFAFSPEHVAAAVRRAIGNAPRARYMAPSFLSCVFALVPFVPTRLLDGLFRWAFGLQGGGPSALRGEPRALSR
jgi:short-subunit dehydrogenase